MIGEEIITRRFTHLSQEIESFHIHAKCAPRWGREEIITPYGGFVEFTRI
jgi:hypothetical protein